MRAEILPELRSDDNRFAKIGQTARGKSTGCFDNLPVMIGELLGR
jgi:hypothetical protein